MPLKRLKEIFTKKTPDILGGRTSIVERGKQVLGGLARLRQIFLPKRSEELTRIQEQRRQTLLPNEAIRSIREREREFGVIPTRPVGEVELARRAPGTVTRQEFQQFLKRPRFDPIGAIAASRRVVAGLGERVVRRIAKSSVADDIARLLSRSKTIAKKEIPELAKSLTKEKNVETIGKVLNQAELRFKAGGAKKRLTEIFEKPAREQIRLDAPAKLPSRAISKPLLQRTPARTPAISKDLEPLAKEAGKFKTAEEFVKSQELVFRATDKSFDAKLLTDDG